MRLLKLLLVPAALAIAPAAFAAAPPAGNAGESVGIESTPAYHRGYGHDRYYYRPYRRHYGHRYNYGHRYHYGPRCYWSRYYHRRICR